MVAQLVLRRDPHTTGVGVAEQVDRCEPRYAFQGPELRRIDLLLRAALLVAAESLRASLKASERCRRALGEVAALDANGNAAFGSGVHG